MPKPPQSLLEQLVMVAAQDAFRALSKMGKPPIGTTIWVRLGAHEVVPGFERELGAITMTLPAGAENLPPLSD